MAEHFEAKKHAYRQTQDGVVISFVCHPNDVAKMLTLAPLGTRYMVAVEEIGDDERPITPAVAETTTEDARPLAVPQGVRVQVPSRVTVNKRKFFEMPRSQQCALRCQDDDFKKFLAEDFPRLWRDASGDAAEVVRLACEVDSRAQFDTEGSAQHEWDGMEEMFQEWVTTERYAHVMRK